jgi:hypothetical protein
MSDFFGLFFRPYGAFLLLLGHKAGRCPALEYLKLAALLSDYSCGLITCYSWHGVIRELGTLKSPAGASYSRQGSALGIIQQYFCKPPEWRNNDPITAGQYENPDKSFQEF